MQPIVITGQDDAVLGHRLALLGLERRAHACGHVNLREFVRRGRYAASWTTVAADIG